MKIDFCLKQAMFGWKYPDPGQTQVIGAWNGPDSWNSHHSTWVYNLSLEALIEIKIVGCFIEYVHLNQVILKCEKDKIFQKITLLNCFGLQIQEQVQNQRIELFMIIIKWDLQVNDFCFCSL